MRESLKDIAKFVKRVEYPKPMPEELKKFHYYIADSGHCIICVLKGHLEEARESGNMYNYEVPVPAKYVLEKGYYLEGEHVIVDAPYSPKMGLLTPSEYDEF